MSRQGTKVAQRECKVRSSGNRPQAVASKTRTVAWWPWIHQCPVAHEARKARRSAREAWPPARDRRFGTERSASDQKTHHLFICLAPSRGQAVGGVECEAQQALRRLGACAAGLTAAKGLAQRHCRSSVCMPAPSAELGRARTLRNCKKATKRVNASSSSRAPACTPSRGQGWTCARCGVNKIPRGAACPHASNQPT